MENENSGRPLPVAEQIHDLMKEGVLNPETLSINLIKWIGWGNDRDLKEFMDSYYPEALRKHWSLHDEF